MYLEGILKRNIVDEIEFNLLHKVLTINEYASHYPDGAADCSPSTVVALTFSFFGTTSLLVGGSIRRVRGLLLAEMNGNFVLSNGAAANNSIIINKVKRFSDKGILARKVLQEGVLIY